MRNKLKSVMDFSPAYIPAEKELFQDPESGLPEIHKVQGSQTKDKATSYMRENAMRSPTILDKLDTAFGAAQISESVGEDLLAEMIRVTSSPDRFDSPTDFARYLTEGILLNVNRLISRAINIPQGEYIVYSITPNKAMLVPTTDVSVQETDFSSMPRAFEVHTGQLLGCWNKAERILAERAAPIPPSQGGGESNLKRKAKREKIQDVSKGEYGNMKYARDPNFRSEREAHDLSLDDIVQRLGGTVDKSTVSRWGAAGGTPSSRVPSGENMIKLAELGIDPETFTGKVGKGTSSGNPTKGGGQVSGG